MGKVKEHYHDEIEAGMRNECAQETKEIIAEIQDYFKKKLVKGDFKVVLATDYSMDVLIDGKYTFRLKMMENGQGVEVDYTFGVSFIKLQEFSIEEKKQLYAFAQPILMNKKEYMKSILRKQIEVLEAKLKEL